MSDSAAGSVPIRRHVWTCMNQYTQYPSHFCEPILIIPCIEAVLDPEVHRRSAGIGIARSAHSENRDEQE
jgi:hypothetical protein